MPAPWAHARRKFIEAEPHYPALTERPLELIGELFAVEREVSRVAVPEPAQVLEMRQKLHAERSKPVVDKAGAWARETQGRVLPKSAIGKAINYLREY